LAAARSQDAVEEKPELVAELREHRHVRREIYQLLEGTDPRGRLKLHIIEVP